jgi:hypothetical protein
MPKYAAFNPASAPPYAIIGWYDTDEFTYSNLPPSSELVEIAAAQWAQHFANPGEWAVSNGALVAYMPPVPEPTPAQQAQDALSADLTITSAGMPSLNGIYSINATALQNIIGTQLYIVANGKFPGSGETMSWAQSNGSIVSFPSTTEFQAFASAVASYVADLQEIILTNAGILPAPTAEIA